MTHIHELSLWLKRVLPIYWKGRKDEWQRGERTVTIL